MATFNEILRNLRRAVARRGVAPEDVDDVVQEAFVRLEAYTQAHEVRSEPAFLMQTAINIGRDRLRRARGAPFAQTAADLAHFADSAPLPDEVLRARERLARARAGLDQLDPLTRRCLLSQRLEGLTYPAIARREGISVSAAEKRVARGLVFLVAWMEGW